MLDRPQVESIAQVVRYHQLASRFRCGIDQAAGSRRLGYEGPLAHHMCAECEGRQDSGLVLAGWRTDEDSIEGGLVGKLVQRGSHGVDLETFGDRPGLHHVGINKASHGDISQALENGQVNDLGRTTGPQNSNVDGAGHGHGWSPFSSLRSDASEPVRDARVDGHVAGSGHERAAHI